MVCVRCGKTKEDHQHQLQYVNTYYCVFAETDSDLVPGRHELWKDPWTPGSFALTRKSRRSVFSDLLFEVSVYGHTQKHVEDMFGPLGLKTYLLMKGEDPDWRFRSAQN